MAVFEQTFNGYNLPALNLNSQCQTRKNWLAINENSVVVPGTRRARDGRDQGSVAAGGGTDQSPADGCTEQTGYQGAGSRAAAGGSFVRAAVRTAARGSKQNGEGTAAVHRSGQSHREWKEIPRLSQPDGSVGFIGGSGENSPSDRPGLGPPARQRRRRLVD